MLDQDNLSPLPRMRVKEKRMKSVAPSGSYQSEFTDIADTTTTTQDCSEAVWRDDFDSTVRPMQRMLPPSPKSFLRRNLPKGLRYRHWTRDTT